MLTHVEEGFWKGDKPWPTGQEGGTGRPHFCFSRPWLCATSSPYVILSVTTPGFGHNEDMYGFWSVWCFSIIWGSWIVNQQTSWNSLVISACLLYLEWNVGMLAVNLWILWPPTLASLFPLMWIPCCAIGWWGTLSLSFKTVPKS
jgi:hypothetical protein